MAFHRGRYNDLIWRRYHMSEQLKSPALRCNRLPRCFLNYVTRIPFYHCRHPTKAATVRSATSSFGAPFMWQWIVASIYHRYNNDSGIMNHENTEMRYQKMYSANSFVACMEVILRTQLFRPSLYGYPACDGHTWIFIWCQERFRSG